MFKKGELYGKYNKRDKKILCNLIQNKITFENFVAKFDDDFYRGGDDFTAQFKDDHLTKNGMVKTTHGISLNSNLSELSRFNKISKIDSILDSLKIILRCQNLNHF